MTPDENPRREDGRPFRLEIAFCCPHCGEREILAAEDAQPGWLRLPETHSCAGCGRTEDLASRPGRGTLQIIGV